MSIEVRGLDEFLRELRALDRGAALREPTTRFFERAGETVLNDGREHAAVDEGRMRASLAKGNPGGVWEMSGAAFPTQLRVGTNVKARGFSYPKALDDGGRYHYRGGPFAGQPTQGWFTGALKRTVGKMERLVEILGDEIVRALGR